LTKDLATIPLDESCIIKTEAVPDQEDRQRQREDYHNKMLKSFDMRASKVEQPSILVPSKREDVASARSESLTKMLS
jgi:hypothetical protein